MNARRLAVAVLLIAAGAALAVAYPYALFYTPQETQWLVVRATLALGGLLLGALISSAGLTLLLAGKGAPLEAEDTSEREEGREGG